MQTFIFDGTINSDQPLATCSKDLKDSHEAKHGKNTPIPVPSMPTSSGTRLYFPATGIRASLRRACRDVIRNHVIASTGNPTPFSLDVHYLLTLGGVKGSDETDTKTVADEARWRDLNPLLSLFGAGAAGFLGFVEGHLHVGNAITEEPCEPTTFSGARTDDLYRDKSQLRYFSDEDILELIGRSIGNKSRSKLDADLKTAKKALSAAKIKGGDAAIDAASKKVEDLTAQIASVKEASGAGDVSVGMPLAGYQAIPQGERMQHIMRLVRSNELELGCLLAALSEFAMNPVVGAHKATGCGQVSGQWEVFEVTESGKNSLGTAVLRPYEPIQLTGTLGEKLALFRAFLESGKGDFGIPRLEA